MSEHPLITKEHFIKRIVDLCLRSGLLGLPKAKADQHILLKSAVLTLDKADLFTEKEINEKLKYWIAHISRIKDIDHVTLRRWLVDTGYLTRNSDGSCYRVTNPSPYLFADTIEKVDIAEVIKTGQEEIVRRKKEYMEKAGKAKG